MANEQAKKFRPAPNLDAFASGAKVVSDREALLPEEPPSPAPPVEKQEPSPAPAVQRRQRAAVATSLYFFDDDRQRLERLSQAVGSLAPNKKISTSLLLRGLLKLAENTDPKELLAAIKEVSF